MSAYVLGIDGGGTKTRAIILDQDGKVCGSGIAGPSNYDDLGVEAAYANVSAAVEHARGQASLEASPFDAVFLGMAGVVSEADHAVIRTMAERLNLSAQVGVDHDCRIGLAGGLSGRPGIVLIAGTGSSCYGRRADGQNWRSGGWGGLLADEGGAYWFGVQAMQAAVRAYDGRGPMTTLLPAVQAALKIDDLNDIMHRVYVQTMTRTDIATLAPLVTQAAHAKDTIALMLLERGAVELAACVTAVAAHLEMREAEVVLVGGMFEVGDLLPLHTLLDETHFS